MVCARAFESIHHFPSASCKAMEACDGNSNFQEWLLQGKTIECNNCESLFAGVVQRIPEQYVNCRRETVCSCRPCYQQGIALSTACTAALVAHRACGEGPLALRCRIRTFKDLWPFEHAVCPSEIGCPICLLFLEVDIRCDYGACRTSKSGRSGRRNLHSG